jgi:uncharacterized membrane protein YtjA (UPF0391 family)
LNLPAEFIAARLSLRPLQEGNVLQLALIFLVVGIVAALLGFTSIAGASFAIAKFIAGLFLVLFLVFLVIAVIGVRKVVD